jgi:GT2 family glycosyltransferase
VKPLNGPLSNPPATNPNSAASRLSISVVICTRNRPKELDQCLESIARLGNPGLSILVVESGAADGETRGVAERHGARYLHSPRPGLSRARNHGARACFTDLVAFTDDDARPRPGWLEALACEFADPAVMAVGGEVFPFPEESASSHGAGASPIAPPPQRGRRRVVDVETPGWFAAANFGGIGDGGNMCFRRAAFEWWPGFDERLGRGAPLDSAEEHFAYFQLVLAGYRCVHTPESIVWHRFPQTPEEWRRNTLHNLTNAVAYTALLWSEFPQSRRLLLEHLRRRGSGSGRPGHPGAAVVLSWADKLQIVLRGLLLWCRLPRRHRDRQAVAGASMKPSQEGTSTPSRE